MSLIKTNMRRRGEQILLIIAPWGSESARSLPSRHVSLRAVESANGITLVPTTAMERLEGQHFSSLDGAPADDSLFQRPSSSPKSSALQTGTIVAMLRQAR